MGVSRELLGENIPRYIGSALYKTMDSQCSFGTYIGPMLAFALLGVGITYNETISSHNAPNNLRKLNFESFILNNSYK